MAGTEPEHRGDERSPAPGDAAVLSWLHLPSARHALAARQGRQLPLQVSGKRGGVGVKKKDVCVITLL